MPAFYIEVTILEAPVEYPEVGVGYLLSFKDDIGANFFSSLIVIRNFNRSPLCSNRFPCHMY